MRFLFSAIRAFLHLYCNCLIHLDSPYYFPVSSILKAYWSYLPRYGGEGGSYFFKQQEQDVKKSLGINTCLK